MAIVKQTTTKPRLNELRVLSGIVKIWNGKEWVKDQGQFYEGNVNSVRKAIHVKAS